MKKTQDTAVAPTDNTALAKTDSSAGKKNLGLQSYDLTAGDDLPDLEEADALPINLTSEYWTPAPLENGQKEGESKRLFFSHIEDQEIVDKDNGNVSILPTAFFLEKRNGTILTVCNASKRLVGAMQNNNIQRGTALLITYMGKQKNKNNSFLSDFWSIKPLIVKIPAA